MMAFLSNLPIIMVALFVGLAGLLIIDDARRHSKKSGKAKPQHKAS
jgi:hypothetical protein